MDIRDRNGMKILAAERVDNAPQAKKIILLWAGASALLSLAVSLISFLLDSQIELTGGLSGIGLRSVLTTLQTLLTIASTVLVPFWTLGYTGCTLRFARGQDARLRDLAEGFRRFGPALRLMLLRYLLYLGIALLAMNVSSMILSATPFAAPLYDLLAGSEEQILAGNVSDELLSAATAAMIPMFIGFLALFALLVIPLVYRLRLAELRLMDEPRCGARMAMRESSRLMFRKRFQLFRLDLSFWWYFLAEFLIAGLCYGDQLLPLFGVTLPIGADLAFFLFYALGLGAQVILLYFLGNRVQTTYAIFYDTLLQPSREQPTQL